MKTMIAATCLLSVGLVAPVWAANARHPYQSCERKIDNCGPTGDDRIDQLNAQQLGNSGQTAPMPSSNSVPTDPSASQ